MVTRALVAVVALGAVALVGLVARNDEVEALQLRVTTLEQRVSRLEQRQQSEARQAELLRAALEGLDEAAQRLARGDADIGAALDAAEAVLPEAAVESVRAARASLANSDLGIARQYLGEAIARARLLGCQGGVR